MGTARIKGVETTASLRKELRTLRSLALQAQPPIQVNKPIPRQWG